MGTVTRLNTGLCAEFDTGSRRFPREKERLFPLVSVSVKYRLTPWVLPWNSRLE